MHISNLRIVYCNYKYEFYTFLDNNYFNLCYFSDENKISVYFYTYAVSLYSKNYCIVKINSKN